MISVPVYLYTNIPYPWQYSVNVFYLQAVAVVSRCPREHAPSCLSNKSPPNFNSTKLS